MEINQYEQNNLEFLEYQNSETGNNMTISSKQHSPINFQLSIDTLTLEIKYVNTEKKV